MLDLAKVVILSFQKEHIVSELFPESKKQYRGLLKALLTRIDGLIESNDGKINEEIASEIVIASMLYISNEAGEDASEDNIHTLVNSFLSGQMLGFNIPEDGNEQ